MNQQPFNFSWETIHSLTRFSYLEEVKGNAVFKRGDLVSPPPSPPPLLGFFGRGFRDFEISLNRGFQRSSRGVTYRQISLTETTTFRSSIELQRGNKREREKKNLFKVGRECKLITRMDCGRNVSQTKSEFLWLRKSVLQRR